MVLFMLIAVDLWSLYQLRSIGDQLRLLKRGYLPLAKLASHLDAWQFNKNPDTQLLLLSRPTQWPPTLLRRLRYHGGLLSQAEEHLRRWVQQGMANHRHTLRKLQEQITQLSQSLREYHEALQNLYMAKPSPSWLRSAEQRREIFRERDRTLRRYIQQLGRDMDVRLTQVVVQTERTERRAMLTLLLLSGVAFLMSIVILFLSRRSLARIPRLVELTQRIGEGDYQHRVPISSRDEIGILADAFHHMAQSLEERERHLAQQRAALEDAYHELQISSERLLRSERLATIGQLAAQITHEVRNPLNAIGLNLELLEEDIEQLPHARESMAVLQATMKEVERLTLITEEYLRFARLPLPRLEFAAINPILRDTMEFLAPELEEKGVFWDLSLQEPLPLINIDIQQLRQALINLLRNAMQAASGNKTRTGMIEIFTEQVEGGIVIKIRDNGPGIPENLQQKIFDPFYSTKEGGTGLGLPLTREIIVGHGGQITCYSREHEGTTFTLIFPVAETTKFPVA